LWEILTRGETPYPGVNNYEIKDFLKIGKKLDRPSFCPDEVYVAYSKCDFKIVAIFILHR